MISGKKAELLAPAGNFACFNAAINAGADAVYLGGERFGARAYAGNFTDGEIIKAVHIAHIFNAKVYLTVNTLVKEVEFDGLIPYIAPLYEAGLDGAIIQDLGVLEALRRHFPQLALHASTQMAITGSYGADYMKKRGVCRIVPARELSLEEVRAIKEKTGLEIECFIHGSMCYAYSGQCLFSSILGGRSGNRGRCAGPCRLPYTDEKGRTLYPLSLKDMYTLPMLPKLIDSGIDSFKIEGRMKSPEYVAGVTAVYRKYLDLYAENPGRAYKVAPEDEKMLRELYIRSDLCGGYYKCHNGKSMVTLGKPGYSGNSQSIIDAVRETYLSENRTLPVSGLAKIYAGKPAEYTLSGGGHSVTVTGGTAGVAVNRPLDEAEIARRLGKMGDTCFKLMDLSIETDQNAFMPVKSLNALRRLACGKLEEAFTVKPGTMSDIRDLAAAAAQKPPAADIIRGTNRLCAMVSTAEQVRAVLEFPDVRTIYVNADLFLTGNLPDRLLTENREYFLALPPILRKRSYQYLPDYWKLLQSGFFKGVLVRNYEELGWLQESGYGGVAVSDYMLYAWNNTALLQLSMEFDRSTLPLELNRKELGMLCANQGLELVIYGYIPLLYSANCVRKTLGACIHDNSGRQNTYHLTDRYKNDFCLVQNCLHCYNVLYNTVPLSLHGQMEAIREKGYSVLRLDFSVENAEQTRRVMEYFSGSGAVFPCKAFTNGHYKRGVE